MVDYRDKIILAPMVRMGTLPFRLLSLNYGADLVWTEEIVDWKLANCKRIVNPVLNTVDFIDVLDNSLIFRTCNAEKEKVILQIGTACPDRALQACKIVENDVAGIDLNMGCPKDFSVKGGMGAALLTNPERAKAILTTLIANLSIPVTCKIRILPKMEDTIELVRQLVSTGISAITVHGRTKYQRPRHAVNISAIKEICATLSIPTICNGGSKDIQNRDDILKFRDQCGTSSVMVARAAQWNCSIFRQEGKLDLTTVIKDYLKISVDYDNLSSNTKYCIQNMLRELQESPLGRRFLDAQTMEQLCEVWDMTDYCRAKQTEFRQKGLYSRRDIDTDTSAVDEQPVKRQKLENGDSMTNGKVMITSNVTFIKSHFPAVPDLPKSKLYAYSMKHYKGQPRYLTSEKNKLFQSVMTFDGQTYSSTYGEKNKKFAEQATALVCLLHLGLECKDKFYENGSILR